MRNIVLYLVVYAVAIAFTAWLLPGINVVDDASVSYALIAVVFGVINTFVKPLVKLLTCPFIVFTLGLFLLVINGAMLWLTAEILPDLLTIDNFWWAMLGGLVMAIVGTVLESWLGLNDNKK